MTVEYGDLLKTKKCKRVINFDECFSTNIGEAPADVKETSICGQYLINNPDLDIQKLILDSQLKPLKSKSKYKNKERYESGRIVPNGDDLLMAFVTLDKNGSGRFFTRDEYMKCLSILWKEIDIYYGQQDVCIPIFGAGLTRFEGGVGASISQQELLNMIIWSYKLSSYKIKSPYKLRIICKKSKGFSIYKIDSK
ncbi:MAG: macro domain-containing protein [Eubacterium ventriosum]